MRLAGKLPRDEHFRLACSIGKGHSEETEALAWMLAPGTTSMAASAPGLTEGLALVPLSTVAWVSAPAAVPREASAVTSV